MRAKYNIGKNSLEELPEMKEPNSKDYSFAEAFTYALDYHIYRLQHQILKTKKNMFPAKSTFKNWRKHETNAKSKPLSIVFPVSVSSNGIYLTLQFENDKSERITFNLNKEDAALLMMNIDRFYLNKKVTREDYPNLKQY